MKRLIPIKMYPEVLCMFMLLSLVPFGFSLVPHPNRIFSLFLITILPHLSSLFPHTFTIDHFHFFLTAPCDYLLLHSQLFPILFSLPSSLLLYTICLLFFLTPLLTTISLFSFSHNSILFLSHSSSLRSI